MEFGRLIDFDGRSYEIRVKRSAELERFNNGSDNPFHSAGCSMEVSIYNLSNGELVFTSPLTKKEVAALHEMLFGI